MAAKKNLTHTTKGLRPPSKHASKSHAKVYWPYIPLILLLIGGIVVNAWIPLQKHHTATMAYATEMSRTGLLNATNYHRSANGKSSLSLNEKLNAAAQAKAEDMAAKDYWSHNTPDGNEPWIFIDAQGYSYTRAGENLAYGFSTSSTTVVGWMNSPTHKANMLDGTFLEVGFGFKNSSNFVGTGEETIVVAMYGTPASGVATPPPVPVSTPVTKNATTKAPTTAPPTPAPVAQAPPELKVDTLVQPTNASAAQPVTTEAINYDWRDPIRITLLQQLTGGKAPWSALVISLAALSLTLIWLAKHFVLVRRYIREGEYFVAHHPILDVLVLAVILAAVYLSQSSGVIL